MGSALNAVPPLVGAAATVASGNNPLVGAAATAALQVMIKDQNEELEQITRQLKLVQADNQALVKEPYQTGLEYLNQAAQPYRHHEDKRRFVSNAFHSFMRAQSFVHDFYSKALVEYRLGSCCVLLGAHEDARHWFQRAYDSALAYWIDCVSESIARYAKDRDHPLPPPSEYQSGYSVHWGHDWLETFINEGKPSFPSNQSYLYDVVDALEQLRNQAKALAFEIDSTNPRQELFERFKQLSRTHRSLFSEKEKQAARERFAKEHGAMLQRKMQRAIEEFNRNRPLSGYTSSRDVQAQIPGISPEEERREEERIASIRQLSKQCNSLVDDFCKQFASRIDSYREPRTPARAWWRKW